MAKLVLAVGVPHPPRLVFEMQQAPGKTKGEALMKQVREQVEKAEPDLIIEVERGGCGTPGRQNQLWHGISYLRKVERRFRRPS